VTSLRNTWLRSIRPRGSDWSWGIAAFVLHFCEFFFAMRGIPNSWAFVLATWGTGLLIGLCLASRPSAWGLIFIAGVMSALLANNFAQVHLEQSELASALAALIGPVVAVLAASASWRLAGPGVGLKWARPDLNHMRDAVIVILICGLLAPLVSAGSSLALASMFFGNSASCPFSFTWTAGAVGCIIIVPSILAWTTSWRILWRKSRRRLLAEFLCYAAFAVIVGLTFNLRLEGWAQVVLPSVLVIPMFVAAIIFGPVGAVTTGFILAVAAEGFTSSRMGPFVGLFNSPGDRIIAFQVLAAISASGSLLLAASIAERRKFLASIETERERLDLAVRGSSLGIWDWDIESDITKWTGSIQHRLAATSHVAGSVWARALHPEDRERVRASIDAHLTRGAPYEVEYRLQFNDGSYRWLASRGQSVRDGSGKAVRMVGTVTDITDRVEATSRLSDSQARYKNFIEHSTEGIWRVSIDPPISTALPAAEQSRLIFERSVFAECNEAMARMYGLENSSELLGLEVAQVLPPLDPRNVAFILAFIAAGYRLVDAESFEVGADGRSHIFLNNMTGILEKGMMIGAWGTQRDATARKHAEDQLRRSEEKFRSLFQQHPYPMWGYETGTLRFLFVNEAAERMYGYSKEDFLRMRVVDLRAPDQPLDTEHWVGRLAANEAQAFNTRHTTKSGQIIDVLVSGAAIPWEAEHDVRLATVIDITDKTVAERIRDEHSRILELIAGDAPLDDILLAIATGVERIEPQVLASVLVLEPDGTTIRSAAAPSLPTAYMNALEGLQIGVSVGSCGTAMATGKRVVVSDISTDPLWENYRAFAIPHGLQACWSEPIKGTDGRVLGSFAMYHRAIHEPSKREIRLISAASSLAGIAIERRQIAAALRETEARLRATFDQTSIGITQIDPTGRFLFVNARASEILGRSVEELLGMSFSQVTHPGDLERNVEIMQSSLESGDGFDIQKRYIKPDGQTVWADVSVRIVRDADGQAKYLITAIYDITSRKATESALKDSEEKFKQIAETIDQVFWMTDAAGTRMIYLSPSFERIWGIPTQQIFQNLESWSESIYYEDRPRIDQEMSRIRSAGQATEFDLQYRITKPDGRIRWIHDRGRVVMQPDGKPSVQIGIAEDITDAREAEDALRRSEAKYRRIIKTAEEGVWLVDKSWKTTFVNARIARMLGYTPEQMMGRHIHDFTDEQGRTEASANMRNRERGDSAIHDFRFKHADGRDVWTLVSANTITDDAGQFIGALAMVTDMTERHAAQLALKASEATISALFRATPDLIFRMDREGRYLDYAGPKDVALFTAPESFLGRTAREVLPTARAAQCMEKLQAAFETGQMQSYEYQSELAGDPGFWEVRIVLANDAEALLLVRNITDRRRAETALRAAEERYRTLIERLPLIVYTAPFSKTEPVYVSPQVREITGISPDKLGGDQALFAKFIHPEDRPRVANFIDKAQKASTPGTIEYRLLRPDGKEVWLREQVVPIKAPSGQPGYLQGFALDITAAKRAEEALRESQSRYALLINQAPVGVILWNTRFEVAQWNPAAERIFGFSTQEAVGRHAEMIIPKGVRPLVDSIWRALISRRGGSHAVNENLTKDGEHIICEWHNVPNIGPDGSVIAVSSFVQDVTERVNSERRQALMMRELDHRVKNNMAAVLSLAEQTGRSTDTYEKFHTAFIGRVRALARLHTALARSRWNGADLLAILQQAVEPYSGEGRSRLELSGPTVNLPPRVAQSLTMAFNELATNAAKYGALSIETGRVVVRWTLADPTPGQSSDPAPILTVTWEERDGPPVSDPKRRGFGMDLIEGAIAYQLCGAVILGFHPAGFTCTLRAPLVVEEAILTSTDLNL